jgi:O-antigen ligase
MNTMKIKLQHLELGWHVIALTLLSGAFIPLWRLQTVGDIAEGDPLQRIVLIVSYSGICLLVFHWRQLGSTLVKEWPIWLLIGITITSAIWSQAPLLTIQRSFALLLATLYGLLLAVRYPFSTILRLLGWAMAIITSASVASIALGIDWALMDEPFAGEWQGVMFHKNALGRIAVMAIIVFAVLARQETWPWRILWLLLASSAFILVIGSRSASARVVLFAVIGITVLIATLLSINERWQGVFLGIGIIVPLSILVVFHLPEIVRFLDRSVTLTGRVPLWKALLLIGWKQPLLGYGFGAFWLGSGQMMPIEIALMRLRFPWAGHAHNGFIDTWLEVGLIGLLLIVMIIFLGLGRSLIKLLRSPTHVQSWFSLLFLHISFCIISQKHF